LIKGAIFDLDGTLLDSMFIWGVVGDSYLVSIGYTPRENLSERFRTYTMEQAADYYISEYGVPMSREEILRGIAEHIKDYYLNEVRLKPGAAEFLQLLHGKNIKMCVATATYGHLGEKVLEKWGVRHYFSRIFTCDELGKSKKQPDIYFAAAEHLELAPSEILVFEDSIHALKTAHDAGFVTVGIYDEHEKNRDEMKKLSAVYLESFENTAEAEKLL